MMYVRIHNIKSFDFIDAYHKREVYVYKDIRIRRLLDHKRVKMVMKLVFMHDD